LKERRFQEVTAVLFDFDGTLVDSMEVISFCFNGALRKYGLAEVSQDEVAPMIGQPLTRMFEATTNLVPAHLLTEEYRRVFAEHAPGSSNLFPGVAELIPSISTTRKLGLVTSRNSPGAIRLLQNFGLDEHFSAVVGIDHVMNGKPDPEPVLLALKELCTPAAKTVLVGDTPDDVKAGKLAGTLTIGITTGSFTWDQLTEAGADHVVDSIAELRPLLGLSRVEAC
jgi:pyrophosphatase PpaX